MKLLSKNFDCTLALNYIYASAFYYYDERGVFWVGSHCRLLTIRIKTQSLPKSIGRKSRTDVRINEITHVNVNILIKETRQNLLEILCVYR